MQKLKKKAQKRNEENINGKRPESSAIFLHRSPKSEDEESKSLLGNNDGGG